MIDPNEEAAAYRREAELRPQCGCAAGWSVVTRDNERMGVCAKCGAEKRESGRTTAAETFREVPPASPLAAMKSHPFRSLRPGEALANGEAHELYARGIATITAPSDTREPLAALKGAVMRLESTVSERPDATAPPTPAAMLGEALALMDRARVLALNAFDQMPETMLSRTNGVVRFGDARQWVEWLKREAEAREAKNAR